MVVQHIKGTLHMFEGVIFIGTCYQSRQTTQHIVFASAALSRTVCTFDKPFSKAVARMLAFSTLILFDFAPRNKF